jgi:hypothetical protein
VSRGKRVVPLGANKIKQSAEFDQAVANNAGVWGATGSIFPAKIIYNATAELLAEVADQMLNSKTLSHGASVANIIGFGIGIAFCVQAHGDTRYLGKLLSEQ